MRKSKYLNREVKIVFYDHAISPENGTPTICTVWGRIIKVSKKQFIVAWWDLDIVDKAALDQNREKVSIIRGAIIDIFFTD